MKRFRRVAALFLLLLISPVALLGGEGAGYRNTYRFPDLSYGSHERQKLDLYLPAGASGDVGLLLFIHGGAWVGGDKEGYRQELEIWSGKGYAAAAVNYHYVSEDVHMDTLMNDITLALRTIKKKAAEKGVSVTRVMLAGGSAGAHMALLYAYAYADRAPVRPVAVYSNVGPAMLWDPDFVFHSDIGAPEALAELLSNVCGYRFTPDSFAEAEPALWEVSPVTYVTEKTVPTLMAYGERDFIVHIAQADALNAKLTACGVPHDFVRSADAGHNLEADRAAARRARSLFERYAATYLKNGGNGERK